MLLRDMIERLEDYYGRSELLDLLLENDRINPIIIEIWDDLDDKFKYTDEEMREIHSDERSDSIAEGYYAGRDDNL
jgi:hypothetical protein